MNSHPLLTLLIPTLVAVLSWFAGSWLAAKRDRVNKRRELRVQYLIDAYRRLESASHRPLVPPYSSDVESAVADIQLFGTPDQVTAAQTFVNEMAQQRRASLDDLLSSLRNDLREELRLERVEGSIIHLRIAFPEDDKAEKMRRK